MKKTKFIAAILTMIALSPAISSADETDPTAPPVTPGTKTTYYGTEASNNPNNPCKGATIRKCGEIEQTSITTPQGTMIKKVVKNANGQIISVTTTPVHNTKTK